MNKKYYKETIRKDTKERAEYVSGIDHFLQREKEQATAEREAFISPALYAANAENYREKLIDMIGFPLRKQREMPIVEKFFVAKDGNVNIYRMKFAFFGELKFYGMYFEQCENKKAVPFVFGFHGGQGTPEVVSSIYLDSANYHHLVRRMTDRGASVFVPQFLLWDAEAYGNAYNRLHIDGKLRQLGGSVTAMELYFLQCVLDYFIANEDINAEKIGVAGMSYGGMYAIHFAAIDTRVKACYSCSWVNDCFVNSWADWSYYNAQKYFTTAETMALIAPRALVVAMGEHDPLFDYKRTITECEKVKPYYAAFASERNFKCVIFNGGHAVDKKDEELDFFFEKL